MSEEKKITSMMDEKRVFPPSKEFSAGAHIRNMEEWQALTKQAEEDFEGFWADKADKLHWFKKWDEVFNWDPAAVKLEWFKGGKLNACYNCIDVHLDGPRRDKVALIAEGETSADCRKVTYAELHKEVSVFANVLKKHGVKKGDRVAIYMPMIFELSVAMLACARIGAVHSIVFGGFSPDSLRDRINDSECVALITTDWSRRAGKKIPLKGNSNKSMEDTPSITSCITFKLVGDDVEMKEGRDYWWHEEIEGMSDDCPCEEMDAEDPLFILYTSGTTGKPKGVLHTTGGYMTYVRQTCEWVFDIHEDTIYWCTADIGWITGHSYIVYGPLALGTTSIMFEGVPTWPEADRFWEVVETHKVNVFYTAPTALRSLMRLGDEWVEKRDKSSLKILGTVGEPINPEAWIWYHEKVGGGRCPIVDTWWQTETGGILITPMPGAIATKPGSATRAVPGIFPKVVDENANEVGPNEGGYLVLTKPWPGMMRTVYGDHERFVDTYFSKFQEKGYYLTGDSARMDEDGYCWLMGRIDDVINVSGHRIGTAEVESALVSHPTVAESAVVPMPHEIKGQGLYAFVTLKESVEKTDELKAELRAHVGTEIGPIAKPDVIHYADALPKTRSGKIMRRILKRIAAGEADVGDTTTLADPDVVESLLADRK